MIFLNRLFRIYSNKLHLFHEGQGQTRILSLFTVKRYLINTYTFDLSRIFIMSIHPEIRVLSEENINKVHEDSLYILEKAGIRVDSERAREIFRRSEYTKIEGKKVIIRPEVVEESIRSAPSKIKIYNKNGSDAFEFGYGTDYHTRFGTGCTNINYQNPITGGIVPFSRKHTRYACKLGNTLDSFDMVSTPGVPTDCDASLLDLYNMADMYISTEKPMVVLLLEDNIMEKALKVIEQVHGNISDRPFIMPYVNPVTPLILNESTTSKMLTAIEKGLPLIFSNYGMSGGTTPIDGMGTLTLLNAELLAGLVFMQLASPGSEVILGSLPAKFNMQSMISTYSPGSYLINLACAEMMHYYRIPHCGTSGSGAGWSSDINAAGDLWMNNLTSIMGKVGIAPFIGGNFDSKAFSPGLVILADNIIEKSRKLTEGLNGIESNSTLQEITDLGPGGDYLTAMSTLNSLENYGQNAGDIWPAISLEEWRLLGEPGAGEIFGRHVKAIYQAVVGECDKKDPLLVEFEKVIDKIGS